MVALVEGLTVVGLIALVDPPKHDARETVEKCRAAGVRFFMVTGDFSKTAAAIAKQIGIISGPMELVKSADDLYAAPFLPLSSPSQLTFSSLTRSSKFSNEKSLDASSGHKSAIVLSGPEMLRLSEEQWEKVIKVRFFPSFASSFSFLPLNRGRLLSSTRSSSLAQRRSRSSRSSSGSRRLAVRSQ